MRNPTVAPAADITADLPLSPPRAVLPGPHWAVIDAWEARLGLPPESRPLP